MTSTCRALGPHPLGHSFNFTSAGAFPGHRCLQLGRVPFPGLHSCRASPSKSSIAQSVRAPSPVFPPPPPGAL